MPCNNNGLPSLLDVFFGFVLEEQNENIGFRGGKKPPVKCEMHNYRVIDMKIKRVLFNNPATIVFWSDGTKTVVKCGENEEFDKEKGLAMAISKRVLGNNYHYFDVFKRWIKEDK